MVLMSFGLVLYDFELKATCQQCQKLRDIITYDSPSHSQ